RLGEWQPASREQRPQPGIELGVDGRRLPDRRRDRLAGQVVRCWPEAARRDHEIAMIEGGPERVSDRLEIVWERGEPRYRHTPGGELPSQLAGIRVAGLADRELGSDREDLGGQEGSHRFAGSIGINPGGGDVQPDTPANTKSTGAPP